MGNKRLIYIMLFILTAMWYSCDKTDDGSHVDPITVTEKINGEWQLLSITMIDETAKSAGITPDEVTLTNQFTFNSFGITLGTDADNNATSYSITGTAPELLASEGFWAIDSDFPRTNGNPVVISLYADAGKTQKTNQLSISTLPGGIDQMELKLTHTSNNIPYVSYLYKLNLVSE